MWSTIQASARTPLFSDKILACLKAPGGGDETDLVEVVEGGLRCRQTGEVYPLIDGIPSLFNSIEGEGNSVTSRVKSFYEENPFPSYEGL